MTTGKTTSNVLSDSVKVTWITGGGTGIGRALALAYASDGWTVVVSGRREDALLKTQELAMAFSGQVMVHVCDVTIESQIIEVVEDISLKYGRLDLVIANAGYAQNGWFTELDLQDWKRQFDVNFFGLISTVQHSIPLLTQTHGQVVLISSVMAYIRFPKSSAYCASKAAVTALGETLQLELGKHHVQCTVIHPGFIESEIGQINTEGRYDASLSDQRPQQFMWTAKDAAKVMKRGIDKRRSHITITWHGKVGEWASRHFPRLLLWLQRTFG